MKASYRFFKLFPVKILVFLFVSSKPLFAKGVDISETLFHHVLNSGDLELFPYLPAIKLPQWMSVHHFMLFFATILILILLAIAAKKSRVKPGKFVIGIETIILFVRDDVVYPVLGEEKGKKWMPFFSSMFIYLLVINYLGLIPAFKTATGNINVTGALAVIIFILTFIVGFREAGFGRFFKNLMPEGAPVPIGVFVAFLEFLSIFTRSIVLALRLFANMFAGHLAILSFIVLVFIISPLFSLVSIPFAVFTYTLEILIAFLQAYVFTLLSCIFIGMASSH